MKHLEQKIKFIIISFLMLGFSLKVCSQEVIDFKIKTSENATERKEMLDLLRIEVKQDINQEVLFKVNHFKLLGNYAWFKGDAIERNGKELIFPDNSYDCCHVEGLFMNKNNKWELIEIGLFSTDCWQCGLAKRYPKIPNIIFSEEAL
ncbi:hypothetical protein [Mangrovimonas futianensis]|uniref:hypothetical protein n=1 Tax=Mangrovimonas futianensis TaxID=2895523 RepID=UPI001E5E5025|nr:hypothetical protein [Mangrovimonas futianensis]MCF1420764.1 hypothetical protein [Mangrovimonas futianensis]